jgi:putative endonuclease
MPLTTRQLEGRWAEQRALRLLQERGWRLVSRNWTCRWGELDLVVCKPDRLLLVEVKGRGPLHRDGGGIGALHGGKRKRLERAWSCWQAEHSHLAHQPMEFVAALVPLPPRRSPVRWVHVF